MAVVYDDKAAQHIERSYQTPDIVRQRLAVLSTLSLQLGESVLDAGCGTGLLLELLAESVGQAGNAQGIDYSNDMLAVARSRCGDLSQVSLAQGSVEQLDFESASFDAVTCTQVLLYVDDVEKALHEMTRVLKPGGRLVIVETDWDGAILNSSDKLLTRIIFDAWDTAVSNPNLPRRLKPMLASAGLSRIRVDAVPIINTQFSDIEFARSMVGNFADIAIEHDVITEQQGKSWQQDLQTLADRGEFFFSVNRFIVSAVK